MRGFPLSDDFAFTRVPNALLGTVLSDMEDANAYCLILRTIWLLERQRGFPKSISVEELRRDRVLTKRLSGAGSFDAALNTAIDSGALLKFDIGGYERLWLNTVSAARLSSDTAGRAKMATSAEMSEEDVDDGGWDRAAGSDADSVADAFRAYEENIGLLSPMIRENITAALEDFTDEAISSAIRIAVENESRSWSFIAGVLRRWARDGVPQDEGRTGSERRDAERGRVSEDQLRRYLERYQERQRKSDKPSESE